MYTFAHICKQISAIKYHQYRATEIALKCLTLFIKMTFHLWSSALFFIKHLVIKSSYYFQLSCIFREINIYVYWFRNNLPSTGLYK